MTLSTHVLDVSIGRPAAGLRVRLERRTEDGTWRAIADAETDPDGRVSSLVSLAEALRSGTYRLTFGVAAYFASRRVETFYTDVTVEFVAGEEMHYHVPLLVSPYGYSTYRGS
jgi:5-hydroxyisourate hydrolase